MNKLMETMESVLAPLATKIGNNKILKAISGGFNMVMAIIILGAIFSLLNTFQIAAYQNFLTSTGIGTILGLVGTFTTDMMAVYVAFTVAYSYVKNEGLTGDEIPAGLLSILAFFIMTPLTTAVIGEADTTVLTFR